MHAYANKVFENWIVPPDIRLHDLTNILNILTKSLCNLQRSYDFGDIDLKFLWRVLGKLTSVLKTRPPFTDNRKEYG